MVRPVGIASIASRFSTCACDAVVTSTTGEEAETVIDSSSEPTFISALIAAVKFAGRSTLSRFTLANPGRLNVTTYCPGRRSTILYWPLPSVTTDRVFSISTSLPASTVTPGNTAPDVSLTTPTIALCAKLDAGKNATTPAATSAITPALMQVIEIPPYRVPNGGRRGHTHSP